MSERFALDAIWLKGDALGQLFDALQTVGEARIVGGAVRNTLMGEAVADIDVATDALPDAVAAASKNAGLRVHETGLAHGTLTVVASGQPFEVTTLREDMTTDGRRATVRFTKDWARDAERRDFTINALYADREGTGIDYVGGLADCLARRVRFIGDADTRILEDRLRILRFFRLHAAYGEGPLDPLGLAAAHRHVDTLKDLSAERVHNEMMRLLCAPRANEVIPVMVDGGFLAAFTKGPLSPSSYAALADAELRAGRSPTPVLGFAALCQYDSDAYAYLADALKMSRKDRARGIAALEAAKHFPPRSVPHVKHLLYDYGPDTFADGLMLALSRGIVVVDWPHLIVEARRWARPVPPISGEDLMAVGIPEGPRLGNTLHALITRWRDSEFSLTREALLAMARDAADGETP
ncbi:MAG: CCA tRNA nucleotidyltransferase [Pseudomonadota bacterium]